MRNRLHSLCPYFAMFPESFVRTEVARFTEPGEVVFDPFSGRGTTLLESLLMNRKALATDVNPVAFCISGAKADIPTLEQVLNRINQLEVRCRVLGEKHHELERGALPQFFHRAFFHTTLGELLFLRRQLNWKDNHLDRFIAALALGCLHGDLDSSGSYFSNQMPRTISTKPRYSLNFWKEKRLWPRKRDVFEILRKRARFRLESERPSLEGVVAMVDARKAGDTFRQFQGRVKAVVTSPPYLNVTNYEEDQWLRLWFLGFPPYPTYTAISRDDRYTSKAAYWAFLREVWEGIGALLTRDAVLVCRIGAKGIDREELTGKLRASLKSVFPKNRFLRRPVVSRIRNRQTDAFRPGAIGCLYEVDYTFSLFG